MLIERLVNNDYKHVLRVKVKKSTALLLVNDQLQIPIVFTTMRSNAGKVSVLVRNRLVPDGFKDVEIPKNSQSYSIEFLILLIAYLKQVDRKKLEKASPVSYATHEITKLHIEEVDIKKLVETLKTKISVQGKNLADYFALEEIKVSKSSLYNYAKLHPELPQMVYGKIYSPEEIEVWRQFLKNRVRTHEFVKNRDMAI